MSDWTQRPLGHKQLFYAAQDAYVTRIVYIGMARILLTKPPVTELKENMELVKKEVNSRAVQRGKRSTDDANAQRWKAFFQYNPVLPSTLQPIVADSVKLCVDY